MNTQCSLENAILQCLKYKGIFGQGLTKYQIIYFLGEKVLTLSFLEDSLSKLLASSEICLKDGRYFLSAFIVGLDSSRSIEEARNTLNLVEKYLPYLEKVRTTCMIGLTGSLASYHYSTKDDIDLLIISSKNRVWITRLFKVLLLKILNVYVHNKNPKIKFCPNLYLAEDSLGWDEAKQNIYTAHEIVMLQPLYDRNNYYLEFLDRNSWVKGYFPNLVWESNNRRKQEKTLFFGDLCENLLRCVQLKLMKKTRSLEVLEKNRIHFLVKDHSQEILQKYFK